VSPGKLAYRVAEAAQATGLGERTLWRAIATGDLPAVKHGRATLILATTLEAWLRGQEVSLVNGCNRTRLEERNSCDEAALVRRG
jgi:excisionase family DNA binding protein